MRLHQIHEEDLAALEATLPVLCTHYWQHLTNADKIKWRQVQLILSNVRWNYGPPLEIEVIPARDDELPPGPQSEASE
jgi:hypothetical protein